MTSGATFTKQKANIVGRPYHRELQLLPQTYGWARRLELNEFVPLVERFRDVPLLVVGSGGSLGVAHLTALAHERCFGVVARACTPLELPASLPSLSHAGVLILSAGGKNSDALAALRLCIECDIRRIGLLCGAKGSPLARLARSREMVTVAEFKNPAGKDGFLAVNSLLAFAVLILRAYACDSNVPMELPSLIDAHDVSETMHVFSDGDIMSALERDTLLVLHSSELKPSAMDLESRFTEAALGHLQPADFRNFAHGRHHWLAKHGSQSAVLALALAADDELAIKTLRLLPKTIPSVLAKFDGNFPTATIKSLVYSMAVAGAAGSAKGIDPGRPHVPEFGRRIYHLRHWPTRSPSWADAAMSRKRRALGMGERNERTRSLIKNALVSQVSLLNSLTYRAIVVDYDGTLCSVENRLVGPANHLLEAVESLLRAGVTVCVATGRGRSVRSGLQKSIDSSLWDNLWVSYYNGAETGRVADNGLPDGRDGVIRGLQRLRNVLELDPLIKEVCELSCRHRQITLVPRSGISPTRLRLLAQGHVSQHSPSGTRVYLSGHSVDILADGVSKKAALGHLQRLNPSIGPERVLCIGDQGAWPGNDFELLQHPQALSVDTVSPLLDSGWNLAPAGCRGTEATSYYFGCMKPYEGEVALRLPEVFK